MKVIEHLARASKPLISFEVIPPLRGGKLEDLTTLIEDLVRYDPPFIDITSHAAEVVYEETSDGIRKKVKRKRPGTLGVCALIQNKYNVDTVPHLLCHGFTREETEDVLIELRYLGIDNVMAIRGDTLGYRKAIAEHRSVNAFAEDLVHQIVAMNQGRYLEDGLLDADSSSFCIGVSGYPEKHIQAPNIRTDLKRTKAKVDAGADYIVTQMFFDNEAFFRYEASCRAMGIGVPIIPGLKILTSKRQLSTIPGTFHIDIPEELSEEILSAGDEHTEEIGLNWTLRQARELLDRRVPALHFFVMHHSRAIAKLLDRLDR